MTGLRLGPIMLLLLSLCMLQHILAAQRSTSVPFPSQSDSCNVVHVNCGGTHQSNDEKQDINPGSSDKSMPPGPQGPPGLKGEMGDMGLKGEKGKDADANLLKMEILKILEVENCRQLNVEHRVNASGYYIMRSGDGGELRYQYCDFRIYRGVTTCDELFTTYRIIQNGYYRFESDNSSYHYCSHKFTCHQLRQDSGITTSGTYSLGKPGERYQVNCNFTPQGDATTEVRHDSMTEMEVNCESAGCYSKTPRYNINTDQILQIINNSQNCRQFIKYRCKGSMLLRNGFAWWVSRDGEKMTYWGQTRRNGYCTCGEIGNCVDPKYKCNCDQNSNDITTQDEGFLTDKTKLPVRELRYGDTGDSVEQGWHTLGQLECIG